MTQYSATADVNSFEDPPSMPLNITGEYSEEEEPQESSRGEAETNSILKSAWRTLGNIFRLLG
jgi:hypothetical protein